MWNTILSTLPYSINVPPPVILLYLSRLTFLRPSPIRPATAHTCSLSPAYPSVLLPSIPVPYVPLTSLSCYRSYLFPMSCYHPYLFLMSCLPLRPATARTGSLCPAYPSVLLPSIPVPYVPLTPPSCYHAYLFLCPAYPSVLLLFIPVPYVLLTPRSCYHPYLFFMSHLPLGPATTHTRSLCPLGVPYVPLNGPQGGRSESRLALCPATTRSSSPQPSHALRPTHGRHRYPPLSGTRPACGAFHGAVVKMSCYVMLVATGYRRGTFGLSSV
jgi:hypothetical protein